MANEAVTCRSCGASIRLRKAARLGQRLDCPNCGTRLEVIGLRPMEVDWAFDAPLEEPSSDVLSDDMAGGPGVAVA